MSPRDRMLERFTACLLLVAYAAAIIREWPPTWEKVIGLGLFVLFGWFTIAMLTNTSRSS